MGPYKHKMSPIKSAVITTRVGHEISIWNDELRKIIKKGQGAFTSVTLELSTRQD